MAISAPGVGRVTQLRRNKPVSQNTDMLCCVIPTHTQHQLRARRRKQLETAAAPDAARHGGAM